MSFWVLSFWEMTLGVILGDELRCHSGSGTSVSFWERNLGVILGVELLCHSGRETLVSFWELSFWEWNLGVILGVELWCHSGRGTSVSFWQWKCLFWMFGKLKWAIRKCMVKFTMLETDVIAVLHHVAMLVAIVMAMLHVCWDNTYYWCIYHLCVYIAVISRQSL